MIIKCESCHSDIVVPNSLLNGQAVRCPYCQTKFIYAANAYNGAADDEGRVNRQSTADQPPVDGSAEFWISVPRFCRHVLNSWISAWKSMFDFGGKIRRREYLEFVFLQFLIMKVVVFLLYPCGISKCLVEDELELLFYLTFFIYWIMLFPLVSAGVRRLHDMNVNGILFLFLVPLILKADRMSEGFSVCTIFAFIVLGMFRSRSPSHAYVPLKSIRWSLIAFACTMLIPTYKAIDRMFSVKKVERQIAEYRRNIPYSTLSWTMLERGAYIVNTDGPANAQLMLLYVMGRLADCSIISAADNEAAARAVKIIRERYKLEGVLRATGR